MSLIILKNHVHEQLEPIKEVYEKLVLTHVDEVMTHLPFTSMLKIVSNFR